MVQDFHFKNMLPPAEVLPDGICESRCLMETTRLTLSEVA